MPPLQACSRQSGWPAPGRGRAGRAKRARTAGGHVIVGDENYGQGSSREHAAMAPRFPGLRLVIAGSFARIHRQDLLNFGVLPLRMDGPLETPIRPGDTLRIGHLHEQLRDAPVVIVENITQQKALRTRHDLSSRQLEVLLAGA